MGTTSVTGMRWVFFFFMCRSLLLTLVAVVVVILCFDVKTTSTLLPVSHGFASVLPCVFCFRNCNYPKCYNSVTRAGIV